MDIRPQAVAGMFYPADADNLRASVRGLLAAAASAGADPSRSASWPKALIAPHAGLIYSGATAAEAFARLAPGRGTINRVVLLGPVHRVPVHGMALPGVEAFRTPLGDIPLDGPGMRAISRMPQVLVSPRAHAQEHSLEVQLPFLQTVLGEFSLLPLAVGDATPAEVAEVLEQVWGGPETVIVISTDLSHYLPYDTASDVDRQTVDGMLAGLTTTNHRQACGATPVNGMMLAARAHGLKPRLLKLCNSGDTAGDRNRVVGYAAFALEGAADPIPADAGEVMVPIARAAIALALGRPDAAPEDARWLSEKAACFITLTKAGRLRGCIGSLQAYRPLLDDIKANAAAAALRDPRFSPLSLSELDEIEVEISLLSAPQPMPVRSQADAVARLRPGVDGVILAFGAHRGTFLPQVWEQIPNPADFLNQLKRKAGLSPDFWDEGVRLFRYSVRKWKESQLRAAHAVAGGNLPLQ